MTTLTEALLVRATDSPDSLAYEVRGERLTWRAVLNGARHAASAMARRGLERGVTCALVLPTSADFIHAIFGAQLLGAVPVALNPRLRPWQIRRRIDELGCALTIIGAARQEPDFRTAFQELSILDSADLHGSPSITVASLAQASPEDLSHLQLTSGTSGAPRAAMIRHRNVIASLEAAHERLQPDANDVLVGWLPLHHDLGLLRLLFLPLYSGCRCCLIEPSMAALPVWLATISKVRGTITAAPDFAYRLVTRLVDAATVDLGSLRAATNGGEPVRLTSIRLFEQHFGVPGVVQPGYGLAEATLTVSAMRPGEALRSDARGNVSSGLPERDVDVRIVDEKGLAQDPGVRGRILVAGPTIFAGYWNDAIQTAEILKDGWLDTGDEGALDGDGYLYVLGRSRAMIKRAGATIAPREVEEAADSVTGVRRSAAIGLAVDSGSLTEELFVVAEIERRMIGGRSDSVREAISDQVRRALGFPPRQVVLVSPGAIPRTPTGKIQYTELKRLLQDDAGLALHDIDR